MPEGSAWVRVASSGLVVEGPVKVTSLLWRCDKNDDTCAIYDGLDSISGKLFVELIGNEDTIYPIDFGSGVRFDNGIAVVQSRVEDSITVCFRTVE